MDPIIHFDPDDLRRDEPHRTTMSQILVVAGKGAPLQAASIVFRSDEDTILLMPVSAVVDEEKSPDPT